MSLFWNRGRIEAMAAGTLSAADESKLREHLRSCDACREHYDRAVAMRSALGGPAAVSRARDEELLQRLPIAPRESKDRRRALGTSGVLVFAALATLVGIVLWGPWSGNSGELTRGADETPPPLQMRVYLEQPDGRAKLIGELPGTHRLTVPRNARVQVSVKGQGVVSATYRSQTFRIEGARHFNMADGAWTMEASGTLEAIDSQGNQVSCRIEVQP